MLDDRHVPIMDRARARLGGEEAALPRPGPIAGPAPAGRPGLALALAILAGLAVLALFWGLFIPPARPALDVSQPIHPSIPAAPAAAQAAPVAPSPAPLAVLADGAIAYAAPDGATLGDVSGRAVAQLLELAVLDAPSPRGTMWLRAEVEGAGLVWLPLGAFSGQAVELAGLPCRGACSPPTPTARPYVAPAPVYVPPPPKPHIIEPAPEGAVEVEVVVRPTIDVASIPTARP